MVLKRKESPPNFPLHDNGLYLSWIGLALACFYLTVTRLIYTDLIPQSCSI
jgi:hypothetical protein